MIAKVVKGNSPTLLHTEKANELIDAINMLQSLEIEYGDNLEIVQGTQSITIKIPQPPKQEKQKSFDDKIAELPTQTLMKKKIDLCEDGIIKEREFLIIPDEEDLADPNNEFIEVLLI